MVLEKPDLDKIILSDEFDDSYQNNDLFSGDIFAKDVLLRSFKLYCNNAKTVLDIGCGSGELFGILPITHGLEPNEHRYTSAKESNGNVELKKGWAEDIPWEDNIFDSVIMWGSFYFVRSHMEVMYEVNRVLKTDGVFIFDVSTCANMPIVQTVELKSFISWCSLFGFELLMQYRIPGSEHHVRVSLVLRKTRNFDYRYFLLPQCVGKINNFLEERDWYLG